LQTHGENTWDEARCMRELASHLRRGCGDGNIIKDAINRRNCWYVCIAQFTRKRRSNRLGAALLEFWTTYGLWSIPQGLKNHIGVFADALRYHLPPYTGSGLTLYRGEHEARAQAGRYGIAWTSKFEVAKRISHRRELLGEGTSIVLRIEALRQMIIAGPTAQSIHIQEHEYIVDPQTIRSVDVVSSDST
jgi:hypothetical protein